MSDGVHALKVMGPSSPALSVLVRTKNESAALPEFWARLSSQTLFPDAEVVFLDSGSTDATLGFVEKLPVSVYQVRAEDFCFGTSCNQLFSISRAPIVCFLSAHVLLEKPDALQRLHSTLHGKMRAAAYIRQVPNEIFGATRYDRAYLRKRFPRSKSELIRMRVPGGFSNAASGLTRDAWEANPFPDIHGSEDLVWAKRHLARGGQLFYLPGVTAMHSHGDTPKMVHERVRQYARARNLSGSYGRALYFFGGVLVAMLREGAEWSEALRYAKSHARAYLPEHIVADAALNVSTLGYDAIPKNGRGARSLHRSINNPSKAEE